MCHIMQDDILGSRKSRNCGSVHKYRFNYGNLRIFGRKFPDKGLPAKRAIQALVKEWRAIGSVANAPK